MIFSFIYQAVLSFVQIFVPRWLCFKRKDIKGQKVLITGAGSGVGRQLAIQFSKHATCLILVDINGQWMRHTRKLLDGRSTVFTYECDVSDYKKVCELAENVKKDVGDVDILVNNAGIISGKYFTNLSEDEIVRTMKVNVMAHMWTIKAFLPAMIDRNSGHLVSIASLLGKVGMSKCVDYCASKYAAVGFAESLEIELRERKLDGIKVTIVYPSHIDTGLFKGSRPSVGTTMTPEYVAKEVVLGVLEESESIYLPSYIGFVCACKESVPRWFGIKVGKITDAFKWMEHFTGRLVNRMNDCREPVKTD